MLPSTRDRSSLGHEPLPQALRRAEEWGKRLAAEVGPKLAGLDHLVVAYAGLGYAEAAAYTLYWLVEQLAPKLHVDIHVAEEAAYHVLAYREKSNTALILFAEEGEENNVLRVSDAARLTGSSVFIISPPQPPIVSARLGDAAELVELPGARSPVYALAVAASLGFEIARTRNPESNRVRRLKAEIGSYTPVLGDLEKRYRDFIDGVVEAVRRGEDCLLSYTPTMRPAAAVLSSVLSVANVTVQREPVSTTIARIVQVRRLPQLLLLLRTDVEEDVVRELKFKTTMLMPSKQPRTLELHIRTDPLTAPIYGSLVAEIIRDRLK